MEALQHTYQAKPKYPRVPAVELDGKRHLAVHQARKYRDCPTLLRQGTPGCLPRRKHNHGGRRQDKIPPRRTDTNDDRTGGLEDGQLAAEEFQLII